MNALPPAWRALVLAILGASAACAAQSPAALDWSRPWVPPPPGPQAAAHGDEYAWRLFVAINWPADMSTRTADVGARLGADRPAIWETWQSSADAYRDDGSDPGPWRKRPREPMPAREARFESLSLGESKLTRHIVAGVMVPLLDPLAHAPRLIEVRMNRASFDYLRSHELYNVQGQLRAVARGLRVQFPSAAVQIKASWRPIDVADRSRYHTISVRFANGTSRLYGLTALNVAAKALPTWFWASFEHVDNATRPGAEEWQLASRDSFACRHAPVGCNLAPSGVGLEGTVWENYRLRGTLTTFVDAEQRPRLLANAELESGLQRTASCITCHSRASIGVVDGQPVRLPAFEVAAGAAGASTRRGYVGLPDPAWFARASADPRGAAFQPLDFVWSMSQGRPRQTADFTAVGDPR
jgi:hypothetical protein